MSTIIDIFNFTLTELNTYTFSKDLKDYQLIDKYIEIMVIFKNANTLDSNSVKLIQTKDDIVNLKKNNIKL